MEKAAESALAWCREAHAAELQVLAAALETDLRNLEARAGGGKADGTLWTQSLSPASTWEEVQAEAVHHLLANPGWTKKGQLPEGAQRERARLHR